MNQLIETSICITTEGRDRVIAAARVLGVPVSVVLAALMRKSRIAFSSDHAVLWKAVRYQKYRKEGYRIWHVSLDPHCYEFGVSERLLFKVSVSLIYRIAIDLFLDLLVKNGLDSKIGPNDVSTNYCKAEYDIAFTGSENFVFWTIKWDRRLRKEE